MADVPYPAALDRIDRALARIDAAAQARMTHSQVLARRHETLRTRMAEAIAALDDILQREGD